MIDLYNRIFFRGNKETQDDDFQKTLDYQVDCPLSDEKNTIYLLSKRWALREQKIDYGFYHGGLSESTSGLCSDINSLSESNNPNLDNKYAVKTKMES